MSQSLLWPIIRFELKFHSRRISTYIYFAFWFVLGLLLISLPEGQENAVLNSPIAIAQSTGSLMAFGVIVLSAICGMAVCRDFEEGTYQLFFTTPLRRRDYLLGRLAGALIVSLFVFSGITLGLLAGTVMPWADKVHMDPIRLWVYIQPYLLFIATTVCWAGAVFFAVGALSRRIVFVYLQGVLFVAIYLGVQSMLGNLNDYWVALFDPFGFGAADQVAKYWTLAETNSRLIPLAGALLWNRAIFLGTGLVAVVVVCRFFPFSMEVLGRRRSKRHAEPSGPLPDVPAIRPFEGTLRFDWRTSAATFVALTRLRTKSILMDLPFIAIAIFTFALNIVTGWGASRIADTPVYPVTYLMTDNIGLLMVVVITAMYSGELVWKERALRFDQVYDALPMPNWLNFASQLTSLVIVQVAIFVAITASGMVQQGAQGYFRFELGLYFKELFLIQLSAMVLFAVFAIFIQSIIPNKFLGLAVVIGLSIGPSLLAELMDKWNVTMPPGLYDFGYTPDYTYSDMNRYGPFVRPVLWYRFYWSAFAMILAAGALLFSRRGTDSGLRVRWRQARSRARTRLVSIASVSLVVFVAVGGYLYYDARVVNADFTPRRAREAKWARYEKEYKQHETLPQPKITAVEVAVDIEPENATLTANGVYTLVNKDLKPIATVHIIDNARTLKKLSFDRPFKETQFDRELRYHIYQFDVPLLPGETVHLQFTSARENRGFQDTGTNIVANGTFSGAGGFPTMGYQRDLELESEDTRRKQGLPKREDLPPPDHPGVRSRNLFGQDADWISFKATVSTAPDQIAIAPGYLTREWMEKGRRYFSYDMGDTKIQNFYTFVSARYAVKRETWKGVNIEVYYDPQHPYNVDRMIQSVKSGLDYFAANFGPYQFRQFRVLEFPRYQSFAQSFANTVPYSESIGFIFHPTKDDDLDYPLYVTAHELAHQWWGHQVVGAWAQGSNILSETLAEYSALMVVEHTLGPSGVRTYLKHDLDDYLGGRRSEVRGEQTLARVTRQGYVWYNKGSLVMYALKDYIGEEQLNSVLRAYLEKVRFQDPPYTTVDDFIETLRVAMPEDRKYLIHDFFETLTLFDNRAISASWRETPEHRFAVTLKVSAAKLRADDKGNESEIPINDLIDIGVFSGKGKEEKALFLEKRRITQNETTIEVVVDEKPSRAGIDPYNKLIDRVSDDNLVSVKSGS